ncbi:fimbrial protein [Lelliottia amnigena]|uniref:Fimbrial protein n=1 Tax=Lelliottia amnigena TaxID=61646 RepID=A0ABU7U5F3_LELAM
MLKKILLIVFSLLFIAGKANASIHGGHSIVLYNTGTGNQNAYCPPLSYSVGYGNGEATVVPDSGCVVSTSEYVPVSGYYSLDQVVMAGVGPGHNVEQHFTTTAAYLDASKSIAEQEVTVTGSPSSWSVTIPTGYDIISCVYLVDSSGKKYNISGYNFPCGGGGGIPLPPTPPIPDTSCTINDGNALSVSLGTLNRDEIPTVPDAGSAISKTISVKCTGGTVTVNMKLNYTPISIGSSQAVKSSANGIGAAIFYSNNALAPSDVTSVNFLEGSNTLTLGFQAVRDSAVALKDIPTGAFTANAVLVMTQQ